MRPLGPTPVKGLEQPVEVYELLGAGAARTRLQASAARGLTRFVGRQRELEIVQAALERAAAGQRPGGRPGRRAGVGKSRLVDEVDPGRRTPMAGWSSSAAPSRTARPRRTCRRSTCSRATLGSRPRDDAHDAREKVTGRLLTLDRALASIVPPLLALLDLPVEDAAWAALDPPRRRRATLDALKRLLLRESQEPAAAAGRGGSALDRLGDPGAARRAG